MNDILIIRADKRQLAGRGYTGLNYDYGLSLNYYYDYGLSLYYLVNTHLCAHQIFRLAVLHQVHLPERSRP